MRWSRPTCWANLSTSSLSQWTKVMSKAKIWFPPTCLSHVQTLSERMSWATTTCVSGVKILTEKSAYSPLEKTPYNLFTLVSRMAKQEKTIGHTKFSESSARRLRRQSRARRKLQDQAMASVRNSMNSVCSQSSSWCCWTDRFSVNSVRSTESSPRTKSTSSSSWPCSKIKSWAIH